MLSPHYKARLRKTLFLGLSDGARTDQFRRANPLAVTHEQVFHAYEISELKAESFIKTLHEDLADIPEVPAPTEKTKFEYVVLLDDFTASGKTYVREQTPGHYIGKIPRIIAELNSDKGLGTMITDSGVTVLLVIYIVADQAKRHIEAHLNNIPFSKGIIEFKYVHKLSEGAKLNSPHDDAILAIQEDYFDSKNADDKHSEEAGEGRSKRLGFDDCKLPVVLSHNTPNNSIYILWAEDSHKIQGLFPRVSRHRKFE